MNWFRVQPMGEVTVLPPNSGVVGSFLKTVHNMFKARAMRMGGLLRQIDEIRPEDRTDAPHGSGTDGSCGSSSGAGLAKARTDIRSRCSRESSTNRNLAIFDTLILRPYIFTVSISGAQKNPGPSCIELRLRASKSFVVVRKSPVSVFPLKRLVANHVAGEDSATDR